MKKQFDVPFQKVLTIAEKYNLSTEKMEKALAEMPYFLVTTPVVGGFSTGKSSLINAVLGEQLLSVNITPETAVPTEIVYGNDSATLIKQDGSKQTMPLDAFQSSVLTTDEYALVQIQTSNAFFQQIPSIQLVDMPGFDSDIMMHNKAIDQYVPRSLAYILAVAANEGTLRESIIQLLNELKLYQMPVYMVITKSKQVPPEVLEQTKAHLTETIRQFLNIQDVKIAVTEAKRSPIDIDEFKDLLLELQSQSEDIFNQVYTQYLQESCAEVAQYLTERLAQRDLSAEDIKLEKEQLEGELVALAEQFAQEKERFAGQIEKCIAAIQSKIANDLRASKETLVSLLLQNSDVTEKINTVVRNAVAVGIQTELEPRVKKYMRNVTENIKVSMYGNSTVELSASRLESDRRLEAALNSAAKPIISAITTGLGLSILGGPIGFAIGAALGVIASILIGDSISKKQEAERRELAQQKVEEIISSVCTDANGKVAAEITAYVDGLNEQLEQEIAAQRERKEKALADTEAKLQSTLQEKEEETAALQADLAQIRGVVNGI